MISPICWSNIGLDLDICRSNSIYFTYFAGKDPKTSHAHLHHTAPDDDFTLGAYCKWDDPRWRHSIFCLCIYLLCIDEQTGVSFFKHGDSSQNLPREQDPGTIRYGGRHCWSFTASWLHSGQFCTGWSWSSFICISPLVFLGLPGAHRNGCRKDEGHIITCAWACANFLQHSEAIFNCILAEEWFQQGR